MAMLKHRNTYNTDTPCRLRHRFAPLSCATSRCGRQVYDGAKAFLVASKVMLPSIAHASEGPAGPGRAPRRKSPPGTSLVATGVALKPCPRLPSKPRSRAHLALLGLVGGAGRRRRVAEGHPAVVERVWRLPLPPAGPHIEVVPPNGLMGRILSVWRWHPAASAETPRAAASETPPAGQVALRAEPAATRLGSGLSGYRS